MKFFFFVKKKSNYFRTNSDLYVKVEIYYGTIKLDEVKSKPLKYEKILKKVDYIIFSDV
jgi:hypothetical protein